MSITKPEGGLSAWSSWRGLKAKILIKIKKNPKFVPMHQGHGYGGGNLYFLMENSFPRMKDECWHNQGEHRHRCGSSQENRLTFILVIPQQGKERKPDLLTGLLPSALPRRKLGERICGQTESTPSAYCVPCMLSTSHASFQHILTTPSDICP